MEIVDLSRELFHRTQTNPSHPPVIMSVWNAKASVRYLLSHVLKRTSRSRPCPDIPGSSALEARARSAAAATRGTSP